MPLTRDDVEVWHFTRPIQAALEELLRTASIKSSLRSDDVKSANCAARLTLTSLDLLRSLSTSFFERSLLSDLDA